MADYYDSKDLAKFGEISIQCPYCIDAYTSSSYEKGYSEEQMMEAVHVAAAIKGGAALVHGVQMMNKVDKIGM